MTEEEADLLVTKGLYYVTIMASKDKRNGMLKVKNILRKRKLIICKK